MIWSYNDTVTDSAFSVVFTDLESAHDFNCFVNCTCFSNSPSCNGTVEPIIPDWTGCTWLPANHAFFQVANIFLLLSYLAPNGIYGILFLRIVLFLGSLFFCLWGWLVLCAFDTFLWNAIFGVINLIQAGLILHTIWPEKFTPEAEEVYKRLFGPLNVPRHSFKHLMAIASVEHLEEGDYYAREGATKTDSLSMLFCGSLNVLLKGEYLHSVNEYQFVDSPEYLMFDDMHCFQVSLVAKEECHYFKWNQAELKKLFQREAYLRAVIENMAGKDVAQKLFLMNNIITRQNGGVTPEIRMSSLISLHCSPSVDDPHVKSKLSASPGEESLLASTTV